MSAASLEKKKPLNTAIQRSVVAYTPEARPLK